jgi:hypothetical protein
MGGHCLGTFNAGKVCVLFYPSLSPLSPSLGSLEDYTEDTERGRGYRGSWLPALHLMLHQLPPTIAIVFIYLFICRSFNESFCIADYKASSCKIASDEFEIIRIEPAVAYLTALWLRIDDITAEIESYCNINKKYYRQIALSEHFSSLSSPIATLRSWVRIPLETWMFVCVLCAFILCLPRVEAGKNTFTVIPASRKRRWKWNPVF